MIEKFDTDLLTESIPGSSWALKPGTLPMDKPPVTVDLKEAFFSLSENLDKTKNKRNIIKLVNSGISIQAIAETLTKQGVNEGVFNPDLAEMLNIPLTMKIFKIVDGKVSNIKIFNEMLELEEIDDEDFLTIQQKLAPNNVDSDPKIDALERKLNSSFENTKEDTNQGFMPFPKKGV